MFYRTTVDTIGVGDTVIFYISPLDLTAVVVSPDSIISNRLGKFSHNEMIGSRYGSRLSSMDKKKTAVLLRPNAELWTRALPHRTQILYLPDISFIIRQLNARPGMTAIESGTGSGSFSHSLARALLPNGRLFSFEFHPERAAKAKHEFLIHGLESVVCVQCQDFVTHGFEHKDAVDMVFLDLPSPWDALPNARDAMKKDGSAVICCYSPCMEQVLRTLEGLRALHFIDLRLYEVLSFDHRVGIVDDSDAEVHFRGKKRIHGAESMQVITTPLMETRGHTSYLTFARLPCC